MRRLFRYIENVENTKTHQMEYGWLREWMTKDNYKRRKLSFLDQIEHSDFIIKFFGNKFLEEFKVRKTKETIVRIC